MIGIPTGALLCKSSEPIHSCQAQIKKNNKQPSPAVIGAAFCRGFFSVTQQKASAADWRAAAYPCDECHRAAGPSWRKIWQVSFWFTETKRGFSWRHHSCAGDTSFEPTHRSGGHFDFKIFKGVDKWCNNWHDYKLQLNHNILTFTDKKRKINEDVSCAA